MYHQACYILIKHPILYLQSLMAQHLLKVTMALDSYQKENHTHIIKSSVYH